MKRREDRCRVTRPLAFIAGLAVLVDAGRCCELPPRRRASHRPEVPDRSWPPARFIGRSSRPPVAASLSARPPPAGGSARRGAPRSPMARRRPASCRTSWKESPLSVSRSGSCSGRPERASTSTSGSGAPARASRSGPGDRRGHRSADRPASAFGRGGRGARAGALAGRPQRAKRVFRAVPAPVRAGPRCGNITAWWLDCPRHREWGVEAAPRS